MIFTWKCPKCKEDNESEFKILGNVSVVNVGLFLFLGKATLLFYLM